MRIKQFNLRKFINLTQIYYLLRAYANINVVNININTNIV